MIATGGSARCVLQRRGGLDAGRPAVAVVRATAPNAPHIIGLPVVIAAVRGVLRVCSDAANTAAPDGRYDSGLRVPFGNSAVGADVRLCPLWDR